jgi:gas vesicle protein
MSPHKESQYSESQFTEPRRKKGNFGMFVVGFLIGGLASATYSLLNVPQSGKETREQIMAKGVELRNRADEEIQRVTAQAQEVLTDIRTQLDEMQVKITGRAEDIQSRVSGAVREGKKGARAIEKELTESNMDTADAEAA